MSATTQPPALLGRCDNFLFWFAVCVAASFIWWTPYPPMTDLPQHVGQVAHAHALLMGQSAFAADLQLNWFTPYLALYAPALLLSFMMPALVAVKTVMTLGYFFYVWAALRFMAVFGGPPLCRWLLLPGYFGFAWQYGMVTFLLAVPFGLMFVIAAFQASAQPNWPQQRRLLLWGTATFCSHLLVFILAMLAGGLLALNQLRYSLGKFIALCWPYLVLTGLFAIYLWLGVGRDPQPEAHILLLELDLRPRLAWLAQSLTAVEQHEGLKYLGLALLALPILFARAQKLDRAQLPLLALLLIWFSLPVFALSTGLFFPRYGVFLLLFYLALFAHVRPFTRLTYVAYGLMLAVTVSALGLTATRIMAFKAESTDFAAVEAMLAEQPPAKILSLAAGTHSQAALSDNMYSHYASWLQASGRHLTEFNFAVFRPQLVRYAGALPKVQRTGQTAPPDNQLSFNWQSYDGARYDYYVVLSKQPVSAEIFANPGCAVEPALKSGRWWVFVNRGCAAK